RRGRRQGLHAPGQLVRPAKRGHEGSVLHLRLAPPDRHRLVPRELARPFDLKPRSSKMVFCALLVLAAPKVPAEDSAKEASTATDAFVVVAPHVAVGTRHFDYADKISTGQRSYDLGAAPLVGVSGEVYPGAWSDSAVLRMFGVSGEVAKAF